jgi:hypothetical protein
MTDWIAAASCLLAVIPVLLFLRNLKLYAPPPYPGNRLPTRCSVLIPARNEESNIARAVLSVLRNQNAEFEVIVLDDGSSDRTAQVVRAIASKDPRVRLLTGQPLPDGWCGKQHACYQLAQFARFPWLVFVDADVRLTPDGLVRMCTFMERSGAALASGVPKQEIRTFSESLLVPLIHFVLLGFLPIGRMRAKGNAVYGAGCGQLFVARREAYQACGGHSSIRATLHDGLKLPKLFRTAGFATDLFDATGIALCRMYSSNLEVWRGFAKNAQEAFGSPRLIGPATLLLLGGQVWPPFLLGAACLNLPMSAFAIACSMFGTIAAFLPRLLAVRRFHQPLNSVLLHPLGICALVAIQWFALFRSFCRRPTEWKGRSYSTLQSAP